LNRDEIAKFRLRIDEAARTGASGPAIGMVRDMEIAGRRHDIPCRLYVPAAQIGATAPVLIWFHGGGYVAGSLDSTDATCRALADRAQIAVLSVGYRLAPECPYPGATEDAIDVVRWVLRHGAEIDVDPDCTAVGGASAGGGLAAGVAQALRDEVALRCQLLVYPLLDCALENAFATEAESVLAKEQLSEWIGLYLRGADPTQPLASPGRGDVQGAPTALVVCGTRDPLRDDVRSYVRDLRGAATRVHHWEAEGSDHGFFKPGNTEVEVIIAEVADYLADELRETPR